jgi:hypothetical protein
MGKQPTEFIPVTYKNTADYSSGAFMFNVFMAMIGAAALYNLMKGRKPLGKGPVKKGKGS